MATGALKSIVKPIINNVSDFAKSFKDKFSIENGEYKDQLGFHNYLTSNLPNWTRSIYKNKFYHSGDIGDIIYSLPTIRHLGGGCLILSPDYDGMKIRDPMNYYKATQLKEILSNLDFIVKVDYCHIKPKDITMI